MKRSVPFLACLAASFATLAFAQQTNRKTSSSCRNSKAGAPPLSRLLRQGWGFRSQEVKG
jgi:hypothetical protein